MSTMVSAEINYRKDFLKTLLWSGLLFHASCDNEWAGGSTSELGMLGPPPTPVVHVSTVTVTTTIAYNPAATPTGSLYSLLGCYSRPPGDEGSIFGKEGGSTVPVKVPLDKLTVRACLEGCADQHPPKKTTEHYGFVGVSNGRECVCGLQLVPEARKITLGECDMPCSGDASLSCGGKDTVAVYRLQDAGDGDQATSQDTTQSSNESIENGDESETPATGTSLSSGIDSGASFQTTNALKSTEAKTPGNSQGATGKAVIASSALPLSKPSDPPDAPSTGPTIAAVTGSVSGAIILGAFIFLGVRAYKRKKLRQAANTEAIPEGQPQDADKDNQLPRRPVPSAIDTAGHQLQDLGKEPGVTVQDVQGEGGQDPRAGTGAETVADGGVYLVPNTPALESGTRLRHPEHTSWPEHRPTMDELIAECHDLYNEVVEHDRARRASAQGLATPSPSDAPPSATSSSVEWRGSPAGQFIFGFNNAGVATPAPAARPEAPLGERAWHRRKISSLFQPPAGGPPSIPLPPTPPRLRQQQQGSQAMNVSSPTPGSGVKAGFADAGEKESKGLGEPTGRELATGETSPPPPIPPLKDGPTILRVRRGSVYPRAEGSPASGRVFSAGQGGLGPQLQLQLQIPLHTPSGQSNRDTIYTVGEENQDVESDGAARAREGGNVSPESAETVGTSILFPSDDEQEKKK
ncbi:hypothetical protein F5Y11DRAFT_354335 [Daldinia sp. FL1419]|nr:hypothetical protein F5Y11DRAFT_354335 [Daldinia sp. FL1419]